MTDKIRQQPLRLHGAWSHLTLDSIAETAARARPNRRMFTDTPDRASWTDGAPRELTAGILGQEMQIFARKLMTLGLRPGEKILVMMPNITEGASTLLGLMLAGLVPCTLNVVSSADEIQAAAEKVGAVGVVTVCRYAHLHPAQAACDAASRYYGIRFVGAFGVSPPSGAVPMSDWPDDEISHDTLAATQPHQTALVTIDPATDTAHARSHAQLISEALALSAICGLTSRGNLLGTFTPVSAAGVISALAAPLISGAHVHLHGPFQPDVLREQLDANPDAILILPSAAETAVRGLISGHIRDTVVINREPGLIKATPAAGRVTELVSYGEWATWALLRDPERRRMRLPRQYAHPVATALPRTQPLIQADVSARGELVLSGPGVSWALADTTEGPLTTTWMAQGDGVQNLAITAETPNSVSGDLSSTIAA